MLASIASRDLVRNLRVVEFPLYLSCDWAWCLTSGGWWRVPQYWNRYNTGTNTQYLEMKPTSDIFLLKLPISEGNCYYLESISIETSCLHLRLGKKALLVDALTQYIISIQYRWQNWGTLEGAHLSAPSPQWPVSPLSPLASVPSPALVTEQTGSEIGW